MKVLVVKDEDGELQPNAGVWKNDTAGKMRAEMYQEKNDDCTIVEADLLETNRG